MAILFPFLRSVIFSMMLLSVEAFAVSAPALWNVPVSHAPFWGRKAQLIELEQKLKQGPVVVTGIPGVGKSFLAFAYAKQHASKYRVVWVFDASQGMDKQIIDFANKLYAYTHKGKTGSFANKEEAGHYVKTLLRTCAFSWLLILNDAQSFASCQEITANLEGDIIVTSSSNVGAPQTLELGKLEDTEALNRLKAGLPEEKEEDLVKLAKVLDNHPMALAQAVGYINAVPGMTAPKYIDAFEANKEGFWTSERQALHGQTLLHTSLQMSLDQLIQTSPRALETLCFLAMVEQRHIDAELIESWYKQTNAGDAAPFAPITQMSFVEKQTDGTYAMQGYLRDVVLHTASQETKRIAATSGAQIFAELLPGTGGDWVDIFARKATLAPRLKGLMTYMDLMPEEDAFAAGLRLFYFVSAMQRDYAYVSSFSEKLKALIEGERVIDPYLAGVFYTWYGDAKLSSKNGGQAAAIEECKRAATYFEKADPDKARPDHVLLLWNIGIYYRGMGDLEVAQDYLQKMKDVQGVHTDLLSLCVIDELEAALAMDKGNFAHANAALSHELELLKTDEKYLQIEGPHISSLKAMVLMKMAQEENMRGHTEKATALYQEALSLGETALQDAVLFAKGNKRAEIASRPMIPLSKAQSGLGNYQGAEALAKEAISIMDEVRGEATVRRQGVAYIALGDALTGQGKFEEAEAAYRKAQDIFEAISTHRAFDDMGEALHKMFMLGKKQGETPQGRVLMVHALGNYAAIFGEANPRYQSMAQDMQG